MKVTARILLIISYMLFIAWMFYHADMFSLPDHTHWAIAATGAVASILSWILYTRTEQRHVDPFGLPDTAQNERPEQISYMVCFAIYALIGVGAFWYFAID